MFVLSKKAILNVRVNHVTKGYKEPLNGVATYEL